MNIVICPENILKSPLKISDPTIQLVVACIFASNANAANSEANRTVEASIRFQITGIFAHDAHYFRMAKVHKMRFLSKGG